MKKLSKFKNLIFILIAIIIGSIGYVVADDVVSIISANQVGYSNTEKTEKTNVQAAIDELYDMAGKIQLKKINIKNKEKQMVIIPGSTFEGIVYFDPTDLDKDCIFLSTGNTNETSGCMKWYVYEKVDTTKYGLLLDHNLAYGNYNTISTTELANLRTAWNSTIGGSNIDLVSTSDLAKITGKNDWNMSSERWSLSAEYHWLFDYTNCQDYGCKISDTNTLHQGYWTLDHDTANSKAWVVDRSGVICTIGDHYEIYGLRPVITISK